MLTVCLILGCLMPQADDPRLTQALQDIASLKQQVADYSSQADELDKLQKQVNQTNYNLSRYGQDNIAQTVAQSVIPRPHVLVTTTAGQSVAGTGVFILLSWDTDTYNPLAGMHDAVGAPTKLFAPATGVYLVTACVAYGGSYPANTILGLTFRVNGNAIPSAVYIAASPGAAESGVSFELTKSLVLNAGDYVEVSYAQSSGSTITTQTGDQQTWASMTQIQ